MSASLNYLKSKMNVLINDSKMHNKVVLLGKSGAGKTSMRTIIFEQNKPKDCNLLTSTIYLDFYNFLYFRDLSIYIWDCGGLFLKNYFHDEQQVLFLNVDVLVYVFDIKTREEVFKKDLLVYKSCIDAIHNCSPQAKVFSLLNKMDLVDEDKRDIIFFDRIGDIIEIAKPMECVCLKSSIWDDSLYVAWSLIISNLIPNVKEFQFSLKKITEALECEEILLFERSSLLTITNYQFCSKAQNLYISEKVANILKRYKKYGLEVLLKSKDLGPFYFDVFTTETIMAVIMSDESVPISFVEFNMKNLKKHFEKLIGRCLDMVQDRRNN